VSSGKRLAVRWTTLGVVVAGALALLGLVAIFLERILIVVPSVTPGAGLPLGWREVLITAGFLALFVLSRRWFFSRFQPILNLPHP